jgi:hypothetical protein
LILAQCLWELRLQGLHPISSFQRWSIWIRLRHEFQQSITSHGVELATKIKREWAMFVEGELRRNGSCKEFLEEVSGFLHVGLTTPTPPLLQLFN